MRGLARLVVVLGIAWIGSPLGAQASPSRPPSGSPSESPLGPPFGSPPGSLSGSLTGALAQVPTLPPPPPVPPELTAPLPPRSGSLELGRCVATLGQVGCAARLYAQLLCDNIGLQTPLSQLHQSLQASFEQAAIDFQGVTPASIETAAVRYYTPQLCPLKSEKIIDLMQHQAPPSQAHSLP